MPQTTMPCAQCARPLNTSGIYCEACDPSCPPRGRLMFDEYRRNAPHDSDRWASSDRGWAWDGPDAETSFAHYLDYRHTSEPGREGKRVHVCIVGRGIVWCRNVRDARLAIRAAYRRAMRAQRRGSH